MTHADYPKMHLYRQIVQAKLFIDNNYFRPIDLHNISGEAYFSKYHFIREFRKIYKKTPHQYLTSVRIVKAMQMLQADKSVSDTCYEVGFESLGSFSTLFKKTVGITPSAYLLQQRKVRELMMIAPLQFIPGCHTKGSVRIKKQL